MRSIAGIDTALKLLRPDAKYQLRGNKFDFWNDPRPQPTWEEIEETVEKIRQFEQSINTIYLEDYLK